MKMTYFLAGLLAAASVSVFSQGGHFTVPKRDFSVYQYQSFEIKDSAPPTASGVLPGATRSEVLVRAPSGGSSSTPPPNPIQKGDSNFDNFCSTMGSKGYRLVQFSPRIEGGKSVSFRAVFERETPPNTK